MNNKISKLIEQDVKRVCPSNKLLPRIKAKFTHPSLQYLCALRKAHFYRYKNTALYLFYRCKLYRLSLRLGYQIGVNAQIGGGLYLGHRGTIVINGETVIGEMVNISHGVTIGQENRGKRKGAPHIGNKVWIGANAVLVGNITIGDNVLIAPNTFVNFNVPDNSIVLGNPGKIIECQCATQDYI